MEKINVTHVQRFLAVLAALAAASLVPATAASTGNELRYVRGIDGYRVTQTAPFTRVVGRIALGDDAFAETQTQSNALVVLQDSSEVALGATTLVRIGAFNDPASTTPTTITLSGGALRFTVRHPQGGRSNYRFVTNTSQLAVRGTTGLYASGPNGDVISCLQCDPGDAVATVGTQTIPLVSGQTLFVSLAGVVTSTTSALAVSQAFSGTGLATDSAAQTAFTTGVGSGIAAAPAAPSIIGPVAGAIVVGGAAAAVAGGNHAVTTMPVQPLFTPVPLVTPTPSAGNGNATLTGVHRAPGAR